MNRFWKFFSRDPKTSISALVSAVAQILKYSKLIDLPPELLDAITMLGIILIGIFAADSIANGQTK